MITYREAGFSDVAPIWKTKLWGPDYNFEPTSCMCYPEGYDGNIPHKFKPIFFIAEDQGSVVGVYSGHLTSISHFRARGLFVEPDYRGQGVSRQLLNLLIVEARKQQASLLWTTPREISWPVYAKLGFKQDSEFMHKGFRFGPNCYASIILSPN